MEKDKNKRFLSSTRKKERTDEDQTHVYSLWRIGMMTLTGDFDYRSEQEKNEYGGHVWEDAGRQ